MLYKKAEEHALQPSYVLIPVHIIIRDRAYPYRRPYLLHAC